MSAQAGRAALTFAAPSIFQFSPRLTSRSELTNALFQGCGRVINLAIAERAIRRPRRRSARARAEFAI